MVLRAEQLKAELIDRVAGLVQDRLSEERAGLAECFTRAFYRHVSPGDIEAEQPDDLYGAALSLWQFGAERKAGTAKVRAYNPRYDQHGWHTSHTVVEIVNDDMPFLVDSVTSALNKLGLTVHLVIHPVLRTLRNAAGRLTELAATDAANGALAESFMHLQVDEQTSAKALDAIRAKVAEVLGDVRAAVEDWQPMRDRLARIIDELATSPPPLPAEETQEVARFLTWLEDNHFTFLGYREYRLEDTGDDGDTGADMTVVPSSGLGLLRSPSVEVFEGLRRNLSALPVEIQAFIREPVPLMVTKANRMATVHRPVPLDTVIVKAFGDGGAVVGEKLFVGLFSSTAYGANVRDVPFLRGKIARVMHKADFESLGHNAKALVHILDTYPRDELYQISEDDLLDTAMGILHLQERQRTALFVRKDPFERFVSCLVFMPRDRYNTDLRQRVQAILETAFAGSTIAFYTQLSESVHARIHLIIRTTPGAIPDYATRDIETILVEAGRAWSDRLRDALIDAKGEERGLKLFRRYREAFATSYREQTVPAAAIFDIDRIQEVMLTGSIGMNLYRPIEAEEHEVRLKLYHLGAPIPLSDVLPMLEHMGLRVISENPYEVRPDGHAGPVWIHDIQAATRSGAPIEIGPVKQLFHSAFSQVWYGEMEDDGFNRLVLGAGLAWRQVVVLRAYGRFLRQAGFAFGLTMVADTLSAHPRIARRVVELFEAGFDPAAGKDRANHVAGIVEALDHALDKVENLTEDRILRRFINLVQATLRTNYYQGAEDGEPKPYLSVKLDSGAVDDLPRPRPWREIFVYSPRVEAVHLRGGAVARGGIRWSDRREDFRTEVLGLMKAQMVKNGVIVPVGSKGGFVVKRPPADPAARQGEAIECYKTMMRGLLDLTDNYVAPDRVVGPPDVVKRDADDPYLVVAADKGTATFSDIANGVAGEYDFWLGDAFASGGSAGYDHKKIGITARGAWESVKRHFRELGRDTQSEDVSVVGVGDMSGDVFGNGMLLSRHIRLLAAFNHLHIFVDPEPDAATGYAERERLFALGKGSWDQYDRSLISEGGGVFSRRSKSIPISPQMRERFGIQRSAMTPADLIAALLKAETDLLWFGGIGTYIKAADESHAEVGDKANDALRVNARDLRARVVGEGANLALTQRGRIEAARAGCRLNTDFIDNSGGVDCSDHEVNLKILLDAVVRAGDMTGKQRNKLLEKMTDEVADLVLRDNYLQTQALTISMADAPELLDAQARLMRGLEKAGKLDRAIELLPDDEELTERLGRREGLTRPEQAVLLAYGKITLYDALLASELPDDPSLAADLNLYFPGPIRRDHAPSIAAHPLRREIIATTVTNSIVNRVGATFVAEMVDKTGMGAADIARAYIIVRDSFGLRDLWQSIEALDNQVDAAVQTRMQLLTAKLVDRCVSWVLRYCTEDVDIADEIDHLKPGVDLLVENLDGVLYDVARTVLDERAGKLAGQGVPAALAARVSALNVLSAGFDLTRISDICKVPLAQVGPVYFHLGHRLGIAWLRDSATRMPAANHWQKQAVAAIVDDLYALQADLSVRVISAATAAAEKAAATAAAEKPPAEAAPEAPQEPEDPTEAWLARRRQPVERIDQLVSELRALDHVDLSMLAVANRRLRGLMAG